MLTTILALVVSTSIDSTTIVIGDQTNLHLRATCEVGKKVQMPTLQEELTPGIEILDRSALTETKLEDGRIQYDQSLTLTSFQDSLFSIAPMPFVCDNDTAWSKELALNVIQPFIIDTNNVAIRDIKGIYDAPTYDPNKNNPDKDPSAQDPNEKQSNWRKILLWVLLSLSLIGIGIGVYYWIIRHKKRMKNHDIKEAELLLPAEVVALKKLDKIREEKIWQKGQIKEYHTQLTDVIREYIARRFEVSSTEQTSDETLHAMRSLLKEQTELYDQLQKMLTLADLVKFAKWEATPDENEMSLNNAYTFVKGTMIQKSENDTKN
jgi:hypothetical protein